MTIKLKGSTDGSVSLQAPADTSPTGTDITLTLPTTAGSADQFVKNSGTAGTLEYSDMVETSTGIGIGVSSPDSKFEVRDSSGTGIISRSLSTQATDTNKALRVRNNSDINTFSVSYKGNIEVGGDGSGVVPGIELSNYSGDGSTIRSKRALVLEADYDNNSGTGQSYMAFKTDGTEHLRIDGAGHLLYNQTSTSTPGLNNTTTGLAFEHLGSGCALFVSRSDSNPLFLNRNSNGGILNFRRSGTEEGYINITTTGVSLVSNSDYRLKENAVSIADGITRVKQLQPKRFNFIADPSTTVDGFMAHEVQTVVPEAAFGEHDAVDAEGNPKYQGLDQSKLVPLLTAALQEAIAEIETLKTKVAALEAGS